jgi:hypothetical protein
MRYKPAIGSFLCALTTNAVLLYLFCFTISALALNHPAIFWLSFVLAVIGLAIGIVSFIDGANIGINGFFIQGIFVAFGFTPLCFLSAHRAYIDGGIWMSIIAVMQIVVAAMGFITHWQNTYETFKTPQ